MVLYNVTQFYRNTDCLKTKFEYEQYVDILSYNLRHFYTKYRIYIYGRYGRTAVPKIERYCKCCNTLGIEELYHFVVVYLRKNT